MKEETSGNMDYDKEQLFIKQLPTAVFIKNFIGGHPADCEDYLKDFVNSSKLVKEKGNEDGQEKKIYDCIICSSFRSYCAWYLSLEKKKRSGKTK